jgi:IS5 family transposase
VVEADIDYPTDADLLEQAVRKVGGLVRRIKGRGAASRTRFRDRGRAAGRRMKQLARTLRRRTGVAMGEVDRIARQTLREVQVVAGTPVGRGGADPAMGAWVGWSVGWRRRSVRPSGCWPRPTSAWPATG